MATKANGKIVQPTAGFQFKVYTIGPNNWLPDGSVGFTDVSGLQVEVEAVKYKEGNDLYERSLPGKSMTAQITLRKGSDPSNYLGRWHAAVRERTALPDDSVHATVVIEMYRRQGVPGAAEAPGGPELIKQWQGLKMWPSRYSTGDLGNSSEINVEEIVLESAYGPMELTYQVL